MIRPCPPIRRTSTSALLAALALACGCSGSKGDPGATGSPGASVAIRTAAVAPGSQCATGGVVVEEGIDANRSGALDDPEVASSTLVCNGAAGASVDVTAVQPGSSCPRGGVMLTPGTGAPTYVCNGAPGADGTSVTATVEGAGTACPYGGVRLQVGSGTATYACNGAPGANGESVAMTPEDPGAHCAHGGQALQVGTGPVSYVCSGAPGSNGTNGTNGADGTSVTMTPELAGTSCAYGGVRLQVGAGPVSFVCDGAPAGVVRPTVATTGVPSIRYVQATVRAAVTDDGNELVMARGVVIAEHAAPGIHDRVIFAPGGGTGAFETLCDGLQPATTYHVRAFATNAIGTSFGEELGFTTLALTVPALATEAVSNVTFTTAISGGAISDDGGSPVLGRGICWSPAPDPTLASSCASEGAGGGSFIALMTGLAGGTPYHVRAYATNAQGTGYGQDRSFGTVPLLLATVTTATPGAVSYTTATSGGTVVDDHGAPVTSRGVCWGTSTAPTTAGAKYSENGGLGTFSAPLSGLAAGTKYYVRAFAVSAAGTSYGNEVTLTTPASSIPSLSTKPVGGISSYLAGSGGTITTDGGSPITAKGVCWSLNPAPTTANAKTNDGSGPASYNSTLNGLNPLTTYYVRAYATNGLGTSYGNEVSFTTTDLVTPGPTAPVVGTASPAMATGATATSGGYVSSDGGSAVTARGVCWSTSQNPTLADACSSDGTGVGYFASTVTGLGGCGVVYYVRAYATNATGTGYGTQATVSTGLTPTVTTVAPSGVGFTGALSGGTITDGGGCPITAKGVAYSWTPNPTSPTTSDGTGDAAFVSSITGLYSNRTHYVRAYATNSVGTSWGQQEVFSTLEPPYPYLGQSYAGGIVFYIDGTGQHGLVAAPSDQGYVQWGCETTSIATGTAFGTGAANTAAILASCATPGIAARVADGLVLNGYSDWFLPSRDELALMFSNLWGKGLGGLGSDFYWSSSQYGTYDAWNYSYWAGFNTRYKLNWSPVRPVRAF